jgi:peptidoglycan/xylan/chitin deacetylase (PgdA/CDA1 family)
MMEDVRLMHGSEGKVSILMYHSISDGPGPTCIAPTTFRRHMAALADCGYHIVSLADIAAWKRGDHGLPERSVALTFDDGYEDFATVVFPELQARGWTVTVFLPPARWAAPMTGRRTRAAPRCGH